MKKLFLLFAAAVVLSSVAWAKPYGEKSRPDNVGDIVFADGTATAWREGLTLTDAQKKAAVAVIFYVGTSAKYQINGEWKNNLDFPRRAVRTINDNESPVAVFSRVRGNSIRSLMIWQS